MCVVKVVLSSTMSPTILHIYSILSEEDCPCVYLQGLQSELGQLNGLYLKEVNDSAGDHPVYKHQTCDFYIYKYIGDFTRWHLSQEVGSVRAYILNNEDAPHPANLTSYWRIPKGKGNWKDERLITVECSCRSKQ